MSTQPVPTEATKAALRKRIRQRRRAAEPTPRRAADLAARVLSHPQVAARLRPGVVVLAHVSLPHEPPTSELRRLLREAAEVFLPVAQAGGELSWVPDPGETAAAWGVPGQPTAPDDNDVPLVEPGLPALVILPALAATADGRRLGQGGGYYDRLLADLPESSVGGPLLVALVGPGELLADLPTEPHDRLVDVVVVA